MTIVDTHTISRSEFDRDGLQGLNISRGIVPGISKVNKFGANEVLTTTLLPVCVGAVWPMPTAVVALEVVSAHADDATGGIGATKVTVQGVDSTWAVVDQEIAMNGTTAVAVPTSLLRVLRVYVSESGTYASATTGSHTGIITLRVASAGATWAQISVTGYPHGQSEIAAYTIPAGKTGYITSISFHPETAKILTVHLLQRTNADDVSDPYTGVMRVVENWVGIATEGEHISKIPFGPFAAKTDLLFLAKVSASNARITLDFDIVLIDD